MATSLGAKAVLAQDIARYPMPFFVQAYADDHKMTVTTETAKEAFAEAVDWHVVERFTDVSISDGIKHIRLKNFHR